MNLFILYFLMNQLLMQIAYLDVHNLSKTMAEVTLGYWKIRGLGHIPRLLLAYTNTPFNDVQYESREKWFEDDKKNLGIELPNLPYLIDGDFKLSESKAIQRYIIKRSGHLELLGKTIQDQADVESFLGVLNDSFKELYILFGDPAWKDHSAPILEKIRPKLNFLRDFVGERSFVLGYLTLADFVLSEYSYFIEEVFPEIRTEYKFFLRIRHNFQQLPGVRAYYQRPDAILDPFVPPVVPIQPRYRKVKLGYWGIRGLAQVPRLLLSFAGVDFEDNRYINREQWFIEDKVKLGLNFPNLPYLIDGQYNLTESSAIQRYIINRWGNKELLGKDVKDSARLERFLSIFNEVASAVRGLFFNKDYETAKAGIIEKYLPKLEELDKHIGENKFVLGYLTLADFIVAEESHYIQRVFPEEYKKVSFLQRIRESFDSLPETTAYYAKETAFKGPFFPPTAVISVEQP